MKSMIIFGVAWAIIAWQPCSASSSNERIEPHPDTSVLNGSPLLEESSDSPTDSLPTCLGSHFFVPREYIDPSPGTIDELTEERLEGEISNHFHSRDEHNRSINPQIMIDLFLNAIYALNRNAAIVFGENLLRKRQTHHSENSPKEFDNYFSNILLALVDPENDRFSPMKLPHIKTNFGPASDLWQFFRIFIAPPSPTDVKYYRKEVNITSHMYNLNQVDADGSRDPIATYRLPTEYRESAVELQGSDIDGANRNYISYMLDEIYEHLASGYKHLWDFGSCTATEVPTMNQTPQKIIELEQHLRLFDKFNKTQELEIIKQLYSATIEFAKNLQDVSPPELLNPPSDCVLPYEKNLLEIMKNNVSKNPIVPWVGLFLVGDVSYLKDFRQLCLDSILNAEPCYPILAEAASELKSLLYTKCDPDLENSDFLQNQRDLYPNQIVDYIKIMPNRRAAENIFRTIKAYELCCIFDPFNGEHFRNYSHLAMFLLHAPWEENARELLPNKETLDDLKCQLAFFEFRYLTFLYFK